MRRLALMLLCLLTAAGCSGGPAPTPSPSYALDPGEALLSVESGTQATVGQLRIGAANIQNEEYRLDGGDAVTGLTAGLWFSTSEAPAEPPHIRVHPGQVVEVRGIRVRVLEVLPNLVRLAVQPVG